MKNKKLIVTLCVFAGVLLVAGIGLFVLGIKKRKTALHILSAVFAILGILGAMQTRGLLSNVPIFQFGIPAILSIYFDVFSGFVQALVFSLLSMVYIASACPAPEEA